MSHNLDQRNHKNHDLLLQRITIIDSETFLPGIFNDNKRFLKYCTLLLLIRVRFHPTWFSLVVHWEAVHTSQYEVRSLTKTPLALAPVLSPSTAQPYRATTCVQLQFKILSSSLLSNIVLTFSAENNVNTFPLDQHICFTSWA